MAVCKSIETDDRYALGDLWNVSVRSCQRQSSQEKNRKLLDEKDRQLQKRVAELQTQIQRLERKIALLKTENETLKRKQDDKKPLEEKIKTLKKRNAELAAIARRLEEKAKHLQQENMKKTKEITGPHDTDHLKKMFARQRAKDLAEHAKSMLAKDREIEDLRKKCQELADQLSNSDFSGPENVQMYEEKEELVNIIKQAAKERLQLEKQFAKIKPVPGTKIVDAEKYKELIETSETLHREITKLQKALSETERLEIELTQKKLECERLSQDIDKEKKRSKLLEADLAESASQRTQLIVQTSDLQKRLQELEKVNEECSSLRLSLAEAQHECEIAKKEVTDLHAKVIGLETTVKSLEYSTEHLKHVEHDYQQALLTLQQKQAEIDHLQKVQEEARIKYDQAIKSLQDKIKSLEDLCHQQESNQRELTEELEKLRSQAAKNSKRELITTEIQTGESIEFNPSSSQNTSLSRTPRLSPSQNINTQQLPKDIQVKANSNKNESARSIKVNSDNQTDSSKSHDTGFAEDDLEEVTQSAEHSPEPDKNAYEDPELYEIAKKLKELEAETSDSADEISHTDKGEDSGMDSTRENRGNHDGEASQSDSRLSVLAKKGPIQVFMAKYSYDPYQHSPNDNPDAELPLNSGDYVLIYGEMDEDGFYDGELISGRRGLVPSNFIEKVADEDISEFHAVVAGASHHDDDSTAANSIQQDLDFDSSEETDKVADILDDRLKKPVNQSSDTEDVEDNIGAFFPRDLHLDRQLSNSIIISWKPPDNLGPADDIQSYQVFVDQEFKMSVKGSDRTKALLEGVESKQVHRVSVRCVSSKGTSDERSCTIKVGKGLSSATSHTVRVKTKNKEGHQEDGALQRDLLSSPVDFKTSAGGLPEPPLNVQVEPGPQEGNLLLTWLPVTIDTSGFSNGALVTGYVVFADGRRTKEAKGATNDHIVLSANDFQGFIPKVLMVRTLTSDGIESVDSETVKLPHSLIKEITAGAAKTLATEVSHKVRKKSPISVDGRDSDDELDTKFREITQYAQEDKTSSKSPRSAAIRKKEENTIGIVDSIKNFHRAEVGDSTRSRFTLEKVPVHTTVPSIEITRDSSVEQDSSFEVIDNVEIDSLNHVDSSRRDSNSKHADQHRCDSSTSKYNSHKDSYQENIREPKQHVESQNYDHSVRIRDSASPRNSFSPQGNSNPREQINTRLHGSPRETSPQDRSGRVNRELFNESPNSVQNSSSITSPGTRPEVHKQHNSLNSDGVDGAFQSFQLYGKGQKHQDRNANVLTCNDVITPYKIHEDIPESEIIDYEDNGDVDSISGEINPPIHDNHVRLFVALFDYDPVHMSPNLDSLDEELPFREGQILKVYGDKDADGFYRGESGGRVGYIPCNMVSEIRVEDPELQEQLLKETQENGGFVNSYMSARLQSVNSINSSGAHLSPNPGQLLVIPDEHPARKMIALYDYDPQELSPNVDADVELAFKTGDIIIIYGEMDDDGFFQGELNGMRGLVPSNFLQEYGVSDDEVLESVSVVSPARSGESINTTTSQKTDGNDKRPSPQIESSPVKVAVPKLESVETGTSLPNSARSRSVSPEDVKQKQKKSGGILSRGKNMFKKLTR
ncbi:hypothetical protein CHS0354_004665 [Potamilus streckersoni]|uniref:Peripheral-type benzodiazepine receptor-associated protein 1 n=1 Tax=Potamilus streckersoni TaxID=2493646 RepID=A0AAE0S5N1_9BIVA|nr:hypothetical protein CHS0354_004665 [Potamilus streckersoni]